MLRASRRPSPAGGLSSLRVAVPAAAVGGVLVEDGAILLVLTPEAVDWATSGHRPAGVVARGAPRWSTTDRQSLLARPSPPC